MRNIEHAVFRHVAQRRVGGGAKRRAVFPAEPESTVHDTRKQSSPEAIRVVERGVAHAQCALHAFLSLAVAAELVIPAQAERI